MEKILAWILRLQGEQELKRQISSLRKELRAVKGEYANEQYQRSVVEDDKSMLEVQVAQLKEELEKEQSRNRIQQVEIEELAAIAANRLRKIQGGEMDYREQDVRNAGQA